MAWSVHTQKAWSFVIYLFLYFPSLNLSIEITLLLLVELI